MVHARVTYPREIQLVKWNIYLLLTVQNAEKSGEMRIFAGQRNPTKQNFISFG